ncbi:MAG: peptidoglycan DD-metalloendopeptidase family protein [Lachnospiraceae bacterium]|nr:peptidoglycan DD-metalloendopeptidase family protein [Lachnospiraceae bacterium]
MSVIFLKILNISLVAGWLILAVLLLRLILKKAPKWISCLLWVLVALRLLLPFSIESALSLIPSGEIISTDIVTSDATPKINTGIYFVNNTVNPVVEETFTPVSEVKKSSLQIGISVASIVWVAGMIGIFLYSLISFLRLKKSVSTSVPVNGENKRIRICDGVSSPFILGIFRPVIYIPSGLDTKTFECVERHEKAHIKRGDQFWKPLGFILLSVYWFNPLCWVAYVLLCKDIEAACDEKVIKHEDKSFMAEYSQALLDCAVQRKRISACPLAFGENGVKQRVRGVLNYKQPAFWIILISIFAIIVAGVCFLTNPRKKELKQMPPELKVSFSDTKDFKIADFTGFVPAGEIPNENVQEIEPEGDVQNLELEKHFDCLYSEGHENKVILDFGEAPDEVIVKYLPEITFSDTEYTDLPYDKKTHSITIPADSSDLYLVEAMWNDIGKAYFMFGIKGKDSILLAEGPVLSDEEELPEFNFLNTFADYKYEDGQYVVDGDMVFQYKKILVGRSPNAECMGSYIVLTNDPDITYEIVDRSLFSSNMKDWLTDTMIIGMQPLTDEFESFSCWPTENERIARQFDADDHPETDIAGEKGTPVSAVSDGTVVSAEFSTDYGNSIVILSKNALIRYSYLDSINVNECDEVKAGDVIGSLGSTGRSTGPHLGISMTVDEKPVNVMDYYVKTAEN